MSRCHNAIGPNAHMAAYKRLCTVPVRGGSIHYAPSHKQKQKFSLLSVGSNSQIQKKVQEHSNPNRFSRTKIQQNQWSFLCSSQRFNRIFIIEPFLSTIQARIHRKKQRIQARSQNEELRRRRKEVQRI